jgi:hypothetical protein
LARKSGAVVLSLALSAAACGGSGATTKPAQSADESPKTVEKSSGAEKAESKPDASEKTDDMAIPTKCAKTDPCVPPAAYVKKLCADSYPSVALNFFRGGSPWTRGYLTRKTEAVNASGGISGGGYLDFDEEVIVLKKRKNDYGGMQVSGAMGGYYVLRWDGTCNDIAGEELTFNKPPRPKAAKIDWHILDDNTQEALRADAKLNEAINAWRNECKGASSGEVSKKCVKLDKQLSEKIADTVRGGIDLPIPTKHP